MLSCRARPSTLRAGSRSSSAATPRRKPLNLRGMPPRLTLPPAPAWLAGLALAFVLPGLAGHDPWKSLDAIGIGIVYDMTLSRDLLVPHVASWVWLSGALAVLPRAATRPLATGALFGAALGLAFLSSTWTAPAALGLAVVAAHL